MHYRQLLLIIREIVVAVVPLEPGRKQSHIGVDFLLEGVVVVVDGGGLAVEGGGLEVAVQLVRRDLDGGVLGPEARVGEIGGLRVLDVGFALRSLGCGSVSLLGQRAKTKSLVWELLKLKSQNKESRLGAIEAKELKQRVSFGSY